MIIGSQRYHPLTGIIVISESLSLTLAAESLRLSDIRHLRSWPLVGHTIPHQLKCLLRLSRYGVDMANKTGGNTGSMEQSPRRKARRAKAKRREEAGWSARAGDVVVTHVLTDQDSDSLDEEGGASRSSVPAPPKANPEQP
jgi:hypothetical protein